MPSYRVVQRTVVTERVTHDSVVKQRPTPAKQGPKTICKSSNAPHLDRADTPSLQKIPWQGMC